MGSAGRRLRHWESFVWVLLLEALRSRWPPFRDVEDGGVSRLAVLTTAAPDPGAGAGTGAEDFWSVTCFAGALPTFNNGTGAMSFCITLVSWLAVRAAAGSKAFPLGGLFGVPARFASRRTPRRKSRPSLRQFL